MIQQRPQQLQPSRKEIRVAAIARPNIQVPTPTTTIACAKPSSVKTPGSTGPHQTHSHISRSTRLTHELLKTRHPSTPRTLTPPLVQRRGDGSDHKPRAPMHPLVQAIQNQTCLDMSDVVIHQNSSKPKAVGAVAYTKGTQVYLASGHETQLRHELMHVVQQKRGIVFMTHTQGGEYINDDPHLEREADVGRFARVTSRRPRPQSENVIQRKVQFTQVEPSPEAKTVKQQYDDMVKGAYEDRTVSVAVVDDKKIHKGAHTTAVVAVRHTLQDAIIAKTYRQALENLNAFTKRAGDIIEYNGKKLNLPALIGAEAFDPQAPINGREGHLKHIILLIEEKIATASGARHDKDHGGSGGQAENIPTENMELAARSEGTAKKVDDKQIILYMIQMFDCRRCHTYDEENFVALWDRHITVMRWAYPQLEDRITNLQDKAQKKVLDEIQEEWNTDPVAYKQSEAERKAAKQKKLHPAPEDKSDSTKGTKRQKL